MEKTRGAANFICRQCNGENHIPNIPLGTDEEFRVGGAYLRRRPARDVNCEFCGACNSVKIDVECPIGMKTAGFRGWLRDVLSTRAR